MDSIKLEESRSLSWVNTISEEVDCGIPKQFSLVETSNQKQLFGHRSALFYTPTENIPAEFVGKGILDIRLPVTSPDFTEFFELKGTAIPRFWVDLIQRQTHKIRWQPFSRAKIVFTRYDYYEIRADHLQISTKALLDALKTETAGRSDGRRLFYFGAIIDDAPKYVDISWDQELVKHPRDSGVRLTVQP